MSPSPNPAVQIVISLISHNRLVPSAVYSCWSQPFGGACCQRVSAVLLPFCSLCWLLHLGTVVVCRARASSGWSPLAMVPVRITVEGGEAGHLPDRGMPRGSARRGCQHGIVLFRGELAPGPG
jgi:hypothetical protein